MNRTLLIFYLLISSVNLFAQETERLTLLFVGDIMQHQAQLDAARTTEGGYDYTPCFSIVGETIRQADLAVGNLEVTLAGMPYRGYPAFSAPDEYLYALHQAGFDLLLTANNHCLDRGGRGLARTIRMLDSLGIAHTGTFLSTDERQRTYPLLLCKKGFRIAFLNYTYGVNSIRKVQPPYQVNYIDRSQMAIDIHKARSLSPDAIIACLHWGEEYHSMPNREQQALADWLLSQGVTHIIGSHPHVIQPMERRTTSQGIHVVAYSLGNFISNMSAPHTDGGAMLHLEIIKPSFPQPAHPFSAPTDAATRFTPLKPFCYLGRCRYNLVWTSRPSLSPQHPYVLIPADTTIPSLSPQAVKQMNHFFENERNLLNTYNIGISEK